MAITLKPGDLMNFEVQDVNKITFNVHGMETTAQEYLRVIIAIACACTDTDPLAYQPPTSMATIPWTTAAKPVACVVRVLGDFDQVDLDNYLMIQRCSIYLLAADGVQGWRHVTKSPIEVAGARRFNFEGRYSELSDGVTDNSLQLGFTVLMRSILGIIRGSGSNVTDCEDFLKICANICEPVRSVTIANFVASTMLSETGVVSKFLYAQARLNESLIWVYLVKCWGQNSNCARELSTLDEVSDKQAWEKVVKRRPVCSKYPTSVVLANIHEHYRIFCGSTI